MTRIFFLGNEKRGLRFGQLEGTTLPITLAVILAFSIVIGTLHSAAVIEYIAAKKSLSAYYEKLNAHNAGESNEAH